MGAFQGEWHIDLHISPTTKSFCPISLAMIFIYYKDFKTPNINQFGALDGQIQHMAAQKVGFTPRLLRQMAVIYTFHAHLHWNLHISAELETCKLLPSALGAFKMYTHFGPQITPSAKLMLI